VGVENPKGSLFTPNGLLLDDGDEEEEEEEVVVIGVTLFGLSDWLFCVGVKPKPDEDWGLLADESGESAAKISSFGGGVG